MTTLSEALKIVDHLTEQTLKQFPGQDAWLVKEWLPSRLEESIIQYPDDNDPQETQGLADRLRGFDDAKAVELAKRVRDFWSSGPAQFNYEALHDAGIVEE
jgi:hypothetical protein